MEPLSAHATTPLVLRPQTALGADLTAVLREGQILAGEVLQTLDGGSILIGIGRHRVPAQAHVELPVGERFVFEVAQADAGAGIELRLLRAAPAESSLVRLLRAAVGGQGAVGEHLGQVLGELAASRQPGASALVERLGAFVLRPGHEPEDLLRLVRQGSASTEARLLRALLAQGPDVREELARSVRSTLAQHLAAATPGATPESLDALLARVTSERAAELAAAPVEPHPASNAAAAAVSSGAPASAEEAPASHLLGPQLVAELVRELETLVRRTLALARAAPGGHSGGHTGGPPAADAAALVFEALPSRALRALLVRSLIGAGFSEELVALGAGPAQLAAEEALVDLRAELARALAEAPDGPLRQTLSRALAGLEADQLVNLARRESGESQHVGLPFWNGERWTTLHLYREPNGQERGPAGADVGRLTLAVNFDSLGPVRADFALGVGRLVLRLAAEPKTAARIAERAAELEGRLARGGRRVTLAVVPTRTEELESSAEPLDTGFLREHHLVDRDG